MARRLTTVSAVMTVLAAVLALFMAMTLPALAHHKDGHDKSSSASEDSGKGSDHDGDADSDPDTKYTEDNDKNDGGTPNNVEDTGDNQHPSGKDRSVENGKSGNQGKSESDPDGDSNGGADKPNGSGGNDKADQDGNNGCGNDDDFEDDNNGNCGGKKKNKEEEVKEVDESCPKNPNMPKGHKDCDDEVEGDKESCPKNPNMPKGHKDCDDENNDRNRDNKNENGDGNFGDRDGDEEEDEAAAPGVITRPGTVDRPIEGDTVLGLQIRNRPAVGAGPIAPGVAPRGAAVEGAVLPFTGGDAVGFLFLAIGLVAAGWVMLKARRT